MTQSLWPALFEESRIEIRSVNCRVAQNARLEQARLVVERRCSGRAAEAGRGVALQAEQVDVAQLQHVGVRSTMRKVAGLASINLYRLMFEHERPLFVRMTCKADGILRRGSPHLFGFHRSMHVVAIAALDQPLIHTVMERHVELRFLLQVAAVAQPGLGLYEKELRFCGVVRRMAGDATDIVLGMH